MFLISLIIFPAIAYFLFDRFGKTDDRKSGGIIKIIGLMGIFFFTLVIYSDIFRNKEAYLFLILIWYILVFLYYFFTHVQLKLKYNDSFVYNKKSRTDLLIKIFYILLIFILLTTFMDSRSVHNELGIFGRGNGIIDFISIFLISSLYFGVFYELVDMIFKNILSKNNFKKKYRTELKKEIKKEILDELNNKDKDLNKN